MRTLRAKQISTNKWCQRIDGSADKSVADFVAEVAAAFNLPVADLQVVIEEMTSAQAEQAADELSAGNHRGLGTIVAPKPPAPPPTQRELDRADAIAKADAIVTDVTIPPRLKDFVAALRKIL